MKMHCYDPCSNLGTIYSQLPDRSCKILVVNAILHVVRFLKLLRLLKVFWLWVISKKYPSICSLFI